MPKFDCIYMENTQNKSYVPIINKKGNKNNMAVNVTSTINYIYVYIYIYI